MALDALTHSNLVLWGYHLVPIVNIGIDHLHLFLDSLYVVLCDVLELILSDIQNLSEIRDLWFNRIQHLLPAVFND